MNNNVLLFLLITIGSSQAMAEKIYRTLPEEDLKGTVRTNLDSPVPTGEQITRKRIFTEKIASLGLPYTENLPVIEDSNSVAPRSAESVARRAVAVAISAVKGEGMPHDEVLSLVKDWGVMSYFSPEELQFINNPIASDQERHKFSWRYEGLDVLLWALGYKEDIPSPNIIVDVKSDIEIIVENKGLDLAKKSKLRSVTEILDMADYYYRLHWAAIELRMKGLSNEKIDEEIIMERHYALNWLIRYMDQEWDEITTDT